MTNLFKVAIVQEKGDPYDRKWNTQKGLSIVKKSRNVVLLFQKKNQSL
jgi:hypothetical protein